MTDAQRKAVEYPGSLLVSAGAGSGKSSVLTARLMKQLKEGRGCIDDYVIITFTKAAASELRAKISKALSEDPVLEKQIPRLARARIGTIHSFCASLLREFANEAGVNPDFMIMSDERKFSMRNSAVNRVLDSAYEKGDSDFFLLVNTVALGRDDSKLCTLVLELNEKMQSHKDPEGWAEKICGLMDSEVEDASDTPWGKYILKYAINESVKWEKVLSSLLDEISEDEKISAAYAPGIENTIRSIEGYAAALKSGWDAALAYGGVSFGRLNPVRKCENTALKDYAKGIKDQCKDAFDTITKMFSAPSKVIMDEMALSAGAMKALLKLEKEFDTEYGIAKEKANMLDYSDLEHKTRILLEKHPELAERISKRCCEVMVDEYQDVSEIQDTIFKMVSDGGSKLFMVGDIKQSIYKFRMADPRIFIEKLEDENQEKVFLTDNFRSESGVIDCCNSVFERCMTSTVGDIDYDENQRLVCGLKKDGPKPELRLYDGDRFDEAEQIALSIESDIKDGKYRPGDIAILLRAASGVSPIFVKALESRGIPASDGGSNNFFESPDVSCIMSLLKLMDNPHDDVSLTAVLTSPLYNFTADMLSQIRACDLKGDFYTALLKSEMEEAREFVSMLYELRDGARDLSIERIIYMVIEKSRVRTIGAGSNILALADCACKFEKDGYHGLHRFTVYLDNLKEKNVDIVSGNGSSGAVSVLTIHKSKGLEFPVVYICDAGHRFNRKDSNENVLVHPELGLGPKFVDRARLVRYPTLAREAISIKNKQENTSEQMRLLYVAMTRAKHKLVVSASKVAGENSKEKNPESAGALLDWLLLCRDAFDVRYIHCEKNEQTGSGEAETEELRFNGVEKLEYAFAASTSLPSKVTATELNAIAESRGEKSRRPASSFDYPAFKEKEDCDAAEKGTATHLVLQHMNLKNGYDLMGVEDEVYRLKCERFISPRQAEISDKYVIERFLNTDLGKRVQNSENLRREFKFSLLVDAMELFGVEEEEKILLQGTVDCCFEEDDGIVIIDYKTDNVQTPEEVEKRAGEYMPQLRAYTAAIEKIFGKPVKEACLYFLVPGVEKTLA